MAKKTALWPVVILAVMFWGTTGIGRAQDAGSSKAAAQAESAAESTEKSWARNPLEAYHLEFAIIELEDGKRINSRQYSTNLSTNEGNEIKIGTRIPVEAKEGEFQYLDVGTNIYARIGEQRGQSQLTVRAEISNFAVPDQGQEKISAHPVLRQFKIGGTTLLPLGRPIVMGSVDDPNSKRQYQLEVTVTKLK